MIQRFAEGIDDSAQHGVSHQHGGQCPSGDDLIPAADTAHFTIRHQDDATRTDTNDLRRQPVRSLAMEDMAYFPDRCIGSVRFDALA
jgi:hypothetical protein